MSSSQREDDDRNVFKKRKESAQARGQAYIKESGNSDVDVEVVVEVDTKPIAYAMFCSLLATKQISDEEFEEVIRKFEELTEKDLKKKEWSKERHSGKQNRSFNLFEFPRRWT